MSKTILVFYIHLCKDMYNMLTGRVFAETVTYSIVTILVAPQLSQVLPQTSQGVPQPTQGVTQPSQGVPLPTQGVLQPTQEVPQPTQGVTQPTQILLQPSQRAPPPTSVVNNSNPAVVNENGMFVHVIIVTTV